MRLPFNNVTWLFCASTTEPDRSGDALAIAATSSSSRLDAVSPALTISVKLPRLVNAWCAETTASSVDLPTCLPAHAIL